MTDAQIDAAYKAAKDSGISLSKLDKLKEKAQKRRDDAVAAKKAEEEKKTDEANKSTEASTSESEQTSTDQASSGGHSFTTDYFYVDVPSDWKQNEWSVTQLDDHTRQISHKPANDCGGAICIAVAKDNPWPVYGTQNSARPAPDSTYMSATGRRRPGEVSDDRAHQVMGPERSQLRPRRRHDELPIPGSAQRERVAQDTAGKPTTTISCIGTSRTAPESLPGQSFDLPPSHQSRRESIEQQAKSTKQANAKGENNHEAVHEERRAQAIRYRDGCRRGPWAGWM